jgi:AcrR family transcriptional regulator
VRRQRAAETRERIVAAAVELIHGFPIWNWRALTMQAIAEHAGVNVRTVYRHFRSERDLKDEVLRRLQEEAGVRVDAGLRLEDVADLTTRLIEYSSSFPLVPRTPRDPTVAAANERQREALLAAVARATAEWSEADRTIAAGMLDVLWSPVSYERLAADWGLDPDDAVRGIRWVVELVEDAIRAGSAPAR